MQLGFGNCQARLAPSVDSYECGPRGGECLAQGHTANQRIRPNDLTALWFGHFKEGGKDKSEMDQVDVGVARAGGNGRVGKNNVNGAP